MWKTFIFLKYPCYYHNKQIVLCVLCVVCVCVANQTKKKIFLFVTEMWRTGSKRCIVETLGWSLKRDQRDKKEGIKAG